MVAIFTGLGAGAERGSGAALGGGGLLGSGTLGRSGEQVMLNAANGNLLIQQRDEMLVGRGPDAIISRTYNSLGDLSDDNHDNWRLGVQRLIKGLTGTANAAGSTVVRVTGDGSETIYAYDGAKGLYVNNSGSGASDTLSNQGYWIWKDGDTQTAELYDIDGDLISSTDVSGNVTSYAYDTYNGHYRLTTITAANGEQVQLSWSGDNLTQVTTQAGGTATRTRYSYDGYNRLVTVTVDLTPDDNSIADGKTYVNSYTYDGTSTRVASIAQTDGTLVEFGYALIGGSYRIVTVKQWVDDTSARVTRVDYDLAHNTTVITDPAGAATKMVYDAAGELREVWEPAPAIGAAQPISTYDYNAQGKVTAVRRFDGYANYAANAAMSAQSYGYDLQGNLISETRANGETVSRTYDTRNALLTETETGSTSASAGAALTTRYVYDANDRLRYVVSAQGSVTEHRYDSVGNRMGVFVYRKTFDVSGLAASTAITESNINAWYSGLADHSAGGEYYEFDTRGNQTRDMSLVIDANGNVDYAAGYTDTFLTYDRAGQLISRRVASENRESYIYDGLGRLIATTDLTGTTTLTLYRDGQGKTDTVTIPAGGNLVAESGLPDAGDGARGPNLVNLSHWPGEDRGPNLIDLSNWPPNPDALPGGPAALPGWYNYSAAETAWAKAIGPDGQQTAVIRAGQTDTYDPGGGEFTNPISFDTSKAYEFSISFQWTGAQAHPTYFGLNGTVEQAWDGVANGNPYFAYPMPSDGDLQVGRWYRIVGYVLPGGSPLVPIGQLGGVYDCQTGAKVRDVWNYRWATSSGTVATTARFFNYYAQTNQGLFTNFYKPEVHELNLANGPAAVNGWIDTPWVADETQWARTIGPDGKPTWAMQSGQMDNTDEGGGGYTNEIKIDGNKTYEFTYYFRKSDLSKDSIYFGTSAWGSSDFVKYASTGASEINPYFFAADPSWQSSHLQADRWYKVVAYVYAQGTQLTPVGTAGGVFDMTTGAKVVDVSNFILKEDRPSDALHARFFDYYSTGQAGYTTYFGKPEIREFSSPVATPGGNATVPGWVNTAYVGESSWARVQGPDGREIIAAKTGQLDSYEPGGGNITNSFAIDTSQTYEFSIYFQWTSASAHPTYFGLYGDVLQAWDGAADSNPYFAAPSPTSAYQVGHWYKIVGYVMAAGSANVPFGQMGGIFDVSTGAKIADVANYRWASSAINAAVRFFNYYSQGTQGQLTYYYGASARIVGDTRQVLLDHIGLIQSSSYDRAGDLIAYRETGQDVVGANDAYKYDRDGRLRQRTDANGINTYYVYDKLGRRTAEVDHNAAMIEYRYDAADRLVATVRYTNGVHHFSDLADPSISWEMAALQPAAHPYDIWTWTVYDREGHAIETIDGTGAAVGYDYDAAGRLIRTTQFANRLAAGTLAAFRVASPTTAVYPTASSDDRVARSFYDADGQQIGALDPNGYLTRTRYDTSGHAIETTTFATATNAGYRASGTLDQLLATTPSAASDRTARNVYDRRGLLIYTIDPLGHLTEFVYPSNVTWGATGVVRSTIQYAGAIGTLGDYTVAAVRSALSSAGLVGNSANRVIWAVYDSAERLTYAIDASGTVTGYTYDATGNLARQTIYWASRATNTLPSVADMDVFVANTTAAGNRVTRYYRNDRGELLYIVDAEGYVTQYGYDANGLKTSERRWSNQIAVGDLTTLAGVASTLSGDSAQTYFSYDPVGRLSHVWDATGVLHYYGYLANGDLYWDIAANSTADESSTLNEYDGAGRLKNVWMAYGSAEGTVTQYARNAFGEVASVTDPDGTVTVYTYDHDGRVLTQTDPLGGVTTYQYDAFGDRVRTVDANGNASYAYYDADGRVVSSRDAEDYVTETSYTVFGDVASVTRRASNAASVAAVPTYATSSADAVTSFAYDKLGRATSTTDAEGAVEYSWYDAFGQVSQIQSKLGLVTGYAYYRTGRLYYSYVSEPVYDAAGNQTAANHFGDLYVYDARGNVIQHTEAYGLPERRDTTYVYDKADRVIETHLPAVQNATNTGLVYPVEYTRYDARGNVIESDAADGGRTLYYYDKLDRVVASVGPTGTLTTTSYTLGAGTSGGSSTTRVYASLVSLPATPGGTPPSAPGGDYRETTSNYDKLGRLATTSVAGVRTGSWTGSYYTTGVGTVTTSYAYDAMGNVLRVTDGNGRSSYATYDRLGRKVRSVDGEGYITGWLYDAEGNVWHERRWANKATSYGLGSITDPATSTSDRITEFTYDRMGRRLTETRYDVTAYTVDGGGNLSAAGPAAQITYTYNALGEVTTKLEATGDTTTYLYDIAGRLYFEARAGYTDYNGNTIRPVAVYYYDALGNLVMTDQTQQYGGPERVTRYYYTGGRLTQMTDPAGAVHVYYYDAVGRKMGEAYDRVKSDGVTVAHEGQSYGYDLAGNLVRQAFATVSGGVFSDAGDVTTLGYNAYGELVSRSLNGSLQEQNRYDTAGHLWASSSGDGVWRYYLYDAAGNRTAGIANEGRADLVAAANIDAVIMLATGYNYDTIGKLYIDGINATVTAYDARNLATSTIQFKRQLNETATPVDIASSRTYNAFGETVSETDALGYTTTYAYNKMGRALTVQHAAVSVGNADGTVTTGVTPTDTFYYDISGRLIGQQDAGGNRTTRKLLAGTGYGSSAALVVKEYHPDTGVITNAYDAFGDLRTTIDEIGRATTNVYDAMGRLTQVDHAGGLVDYYANDVLGQRTRHRNNVLGTSVVELTDYDVQGRVTSSVAFGGDATTTSYTWNAGLATTGLGSFGGYTQLTTYANGRTATDTADAFGHVIGHTDLGGHVTAVSYDLAGRLTERTVSGETQRYAYLNTGLAGSVSSGAGTGGGYYETSHTTYGYDARGLKTSEYATDTAHGVIENATATYDALGRMASWAEAGNATTPAADQAWSYDAVGNVRRRTGHSNWLSVFGAPVYGSPLTSNSAIYQYDAMNRMTGGNGVAVTYNAAGQRMTATGYATLTVTIANPNYDPEQPNKPGNRPTITIPITVPTLEHYAYDTAGNLASVRIAQGAWEDNGAGGVYTYAPTGAGALKSTFTYDGMNRQTRQQDWTGDGSGVAYDRQVTYDAKGRVAYETDVQKQGNDTYTSYVTNSFNDGAGTAYALGAATSSTNASYKNGAYQATASTATSYGWYDAAVQSQVDYSPGTGGTYHTYYTNSATGVLQSASVQDGRPRSISLTNDALGQALRRDEADNTASTGDPHELWYRFNGKQIGYIGNNDTDNIGYAASLQRRVTANVAGPFKNGQTYGAGVVEFDQAYDAINSYQQGAGGGSYTVRDGDSLSGIAAQLWGDAGLWYKLAQANGLAGDSGLVAGQTLSVPSGVVRSSNNAGTFRPYDVTQAYGDSSPTTPSPTAAKKNKCGAFGAILLVAIAVAVTIWASPAAPSVWQGALAGLAGSTASQAVGLATGIQDKFDFKGLALSAISGGVTAGINGSSLVSGIKSAVVRGAVSGALASAVTQGIGVATGLQSKFDWAGVAAAGIGGGITNAIHIGGVSSSVSHAIAGTAGGIASAAMRSLVTGDDFGDTLMASLPSIIGNTIGGLVGEALNGDPDLSKPMKPKEAAKSLAGSIAPDRELDAQDRAIIREFAKVIEYERNQPSSPESAARLEKGLNVFVDEIARTPSERRAVAQWRQDVIDTLASPNPDFPNGASGNSGSTLNEAVITGDENSVPYSLSKTIDRTGIYVGKIENNIQGKISQVIQDHPSVGIALNVANVGLTVAGGPVRAVAGWALDSAKDKVTGWVSDGYEGAGWDQGNSQLGGKGIVFGASITLSGFAAIKRGITAFGKKSLLSKDDFPEINTRISQKQLRHIGGRTEYKAGGGFLNNVEDAQKVLDAYHSGNVNILGKTSQGYPVVRVEGVIGTNVNVGKGIVDQATSVFIIKGTRRPSIVPTNPNWRPK